MYERSVSDDDEKAYYLGTIWSFYFACLAMSVVSIVSLYKVMDRKYISTFISTKTAPAVLSELFQNDRTSDREKSYVLQTNSKVR